MFNVVCSQKWQSFKHGLDNLVDDLVDNTDEESGRINTWRNEAKAGAFR